MMMRLFIIVMLSVVFGAACKKGEPQIVIDLVPGDHPLEIEKSYIFTAGDGGYQYAYGTITTLPNNKLFLTAVRYPRILSDFQENAEIISIRSDDNGNNWSSVKILQENIGGKNTTNPSVVHMGNDELCMSFSSINSTSSIDVFNKYSVDGGESWTDHMPVNNTGNGYNIAVNDRLLNYKNELLLPAAFVEGDIFDNYESQEILLYRSSDRGRQWDKYHILKTDHSLMEPNIAPVAESELLMNMRTKKGYVFFARSLDHGKTWMQETSNIHSPASPQKLSRIPNSNGLVMVWNNTRANFRSSFNNRCPLSIAVSFDKGYTWTMIGNIETDENYDYSYPSVAFTKDQMLILYYEREKVTNSRSSLKMAKIDLKYLMINNAK